MTVTLSISAARHPRADGGGTLGRWTLPWILMSALACGEVTRYGGQGGTAGSGRDEATDAGDRERDAVASASSRPTGETSATATSGQAGAGGQTTVGGGSATGAADLIEGALGTGVVDGQRFEVEAERNILYVEGGDPVRQSLDVFRPRGKPRSPVVVFAHGGAWIMGSKDDQGLGYDRVGPLLARHGIIAVMINYRLSPGAAHPAHIEDMARAFAWTKRNIGARGGSDRHLFVAGHSAGGHLAALLGTDGRWLAAQGLDRATICGAIPIGGVYDVAMFVTVFGAATADASPVHHTGAGAPPFLVVKAESELINLGPMADTFASRLAASGNDVKLVTAAGRDHFTEVTALSDEDPTTIAILAFLGARL